MDYSLIKLTLMRVTSRMVCISWLGTIKTKIEYEIEGIKAKIGMGYFPHGSRTLL